MPSPVKTSQRLDPTLPVRKDGEGRVRARDAATLVIYRQGRQAFEVLMGERHPKHKFLPKRYVFPGGRVDRSDSQVRAAAPVRPDVLARLERGAKPARARALAATAIRETFEETGLIIGAPDPDPDRAVPSEWKPFFDTGSAPALDRLDYIGRAVTPSIRPMRFNARFFMTGMDQVSGDLKSSTRELQGLHWVPINKLESLNIPVITIKLLAHAEEWVRNPPRRSAETPALHYYFIGKQQYLREE